MPVQTNYNLHPDAGFEGQLVDEELHNITTKTANVVLGNGLAVVRGTGDDGGTLATATGGKFVGITLRTLAGVADGADVQNYGIGESANVIDFGKVYAICEDGCVPGGAVNFRYVAGTGKLGGFTSVAVANETDVVPNATWETTATAGQIAVIKLR